MSYLIRTAAEIFTIITSYTLDEIVNAQEKGETVIP
jgi:hypothetical protein